MKNNRQIMEIIRAYPLLFFFTVTIPFIGGIVGAYVGWDSLKSRFDDRKDKAMVSEKIGNHDDTINKLMSKESIVELGDIAIANGDREAYLKLVKIVENFGAERNVAISELARIKSHHYSMTSIQGIKLELYNNRNELLHENELSTSQIVDNLLFNSQFLFRARAAQLLAYKKENFIPELLLLSIFSDNNLEVLRESTKSFEVITGYNNSDFFMPYRCLGFWYDNANGISKRVKNVNSISMIPFQKFRDKIENQIVANDLGEMVYWWRTSLELLEKLKNNQRIVNENK